MNVAAEHRKALKKARKDGAPAVFSLPAKGETYDPKTDTRTPAQPATTVEGYAVEIPGDPEEYQALELSQQQPVTLFFVPNAVGAVLVLGCSVNWAGKVRISKAITHIRPSQIVIATKVVAV